MLQKKTHSIIFYYFYLFLFILFYLFLFYFIFIYLFIFSCFIDLRQPKERERTPTIIRTDKNRVRDIFRRNVSLSFLYFFFSFLSVFTFFLLFFHSWFFPLISHFSTISLFDFLIFFIISFFSFSFFR